MEFSHSHISIQQTSVLIFYAHGNKIRTPSFKIIQKDLHIRDKNDEPWRLTSQPRPQGGHPRARGNKIQPGYMQPTPQQQELT